MEKDKTIDISETVVVYDSKLATDDRSDKKFLSTSKFCPLWVVCPLPEGYIHVLTHVDIKNLSHGVCLSLPGAIYMN